MLLEDVPTRTNVLERVLRWAGLLEIAFSESEEFDEFEESVLGGEGELTRS